MNRREHRAVSLTHNQFRVLNALSTTPGLTQRELADTCKLGLATVNGAYKECTQNDLVEDGRLTPHGMAALEPHKVENAVIMAAGMSSRFAPISYEKPKGLLKVRGEVLIERQIEQLRAAGVSDIVVVLGYKKEQFFYLERKYGVKLVINRHYMDRNNNESLYLVRELLGNTFICSSDDYFEENPFVSHVWGAYYAAEWSEGPTDEWCMATGPHDRITDVTIGGENAWYMIGHAYFDRAFSKRFVQILEDEHERPETAGKLWEMLYVEHIEELDMAIRRYDPPTIHEFDSLDEVRDFDPLFLENVDSEVLVTISSELRCDKGEVCNIVVLKQGLTNLSFRFDVESGTYVYRHPGIGTEKLINRHAEAAANRAAAEMGIDQTFINEDEEKGWKLSRYVHNARNLDPSDPEDVKRAMQAARKFHESGVAIDADFEFFEAGVGYEDVLKTHGPIDIVGYAEMREKVARLDAYRQADGYGKVLSHNDYLSLNFLFDEDDAMSIIDWEYAGMSDPANDFATFTICSEYDQAQGDAAIEAYLGRNPTFEERRHFWACVVLGGWCWYIWALAKDAEGTGVGEWLYIYYSYCANYLDQVLGWYESGKEA